VLFSLSSKFLRAALAAATVTSAFAVGPVLEFQDFNRFEPPAWTTVDGHAPVHGTIADPTLELTNTVVKSDISLGLYEPAYDTTAADGPVTDNWTLRFDARHSSRQRALWAGLFNDAGTQGYAVLWDSAVSGTGNVTIRKFDLGAEATWSDAGTAITPRISTGHDPLSLTPARIELSWDQPTNTLF